jgi:hypothetical protein
MDQHTRINKLTTALASPFKTSGKFSWLVFVLFVAVNGLVLVNTILHDTEMGYDADDHLLYIMVLPERLPEPEDTREFFSPPLPYLFPSLFWQGCAALSGETTWQTYEFCRDDLAGKVAQIINFFLSIGLSFVLLKLSNLLRPDSRTFKISLLALLGVMTVYYKTFAQVRGEPYVAFFAVLALYFIARMLLQQAELSWRDGLGLGVVLGLLVISRQWGFSIIPALLILGLLVLLFQGRGSFGMLRALTVSAIVSFVVGGWFYLFLYSQHGTFTAFNMEGQEFSFANQPTKFYRNTGLGENLLFLKPTRKSFQNSLMPIFYSETWGDYWGFHVFIREKSALGAQGYSNRGEINPYLGRVNLLSLYPTLIYLAGILTGLINGLWLFRQSDPNWDRRLFYAFLTLFLVSASILYMYFLISYPELPDGSTIKATYMLHGLLILPILGAEFLEQVQKSNKWLYTIMVALVGAVWVHNLGAIITRYWQA